MDSTTVINFCRQLFKLQGTCDMLVADNGPGFRAQEFKDFCAKNGIKLIFSPPYSPQTNGVAERAVQTVKSFLKKVPERDWQWRLDSFILGHNSSPLPSTGVAPAEFNLGRRPKTALDKLRPDLAIQSRQQQREEEMAEKLAAKQPKAVQPGQQVMIRSYKNPKVKWEPAIVMQSLGPRRLKARTEAGEVTERHTDQVKVLPSGSSLQGNISAEDRPAQSAQETPSLPIVPVEIPPTAVETPLDQPQEAPEPVAIPPEPPAASPEKAATPGRPQRQKKPPGRFKDFVLSK